MKTIKKVLKFLWSIITWPYRKIKEEIEFRKRIKKLREQDPFIYK
jgi:hypothetical protein|tara:strand:+ start:3489 stop:3623 length:135 start_codon:yes stop_codon:yes gene_type:complete